MKDQGLSITLSTVAKIDDAKRIATHLVENRLAACINIIPEIRSIYRWQEKIEDESEFLLVIKSLPSLVKDLEQALLDIHPYDTPEIVHLPTASASDSYLSWVIKETS